MNTSNTSDTQPPDTQLNEVTAIASQFMREYEEGRQPRISTYLQTYPTQAHKLVDLLAMFVAQMRMLESATATSAPGASATDAVTAAGAPGAGRPTTGVPASPVPPTPLSSTAHETHETHETAKPARAGQPHSSHTAAFNVPVESGGRAGSKHAAHDLLHVASAPSTIGQQQPHTAGRPATGPGITQPLAASSISRRATERGMSLDTLAASLDLPPSLIHWLDATELEPSSLPPELMAQLGRQLDLSPDDVATALRDSHPEAVDHLRNTRQSHLLAHTSFHEAIRHDVTITEEHRQRWLNLLEAGDGTGGDGPIE